MRHISNQHGFVLVLGLILMTVLASVALGSFAVSNNEVQMASNYRSSVQAVTLAEGALAQVIHWFNNPAVYTDTYGTYHASTPPGGKGTSFFARRRTNSAGVGQFFSSAACPACRLSQFYDVNQDGTGDTSSTSPALEYKSSNSNQKTFLDTTFNVVSSAGNITNIKIFGSANPEEVALVQVTAQSKAGGTATIEAVLGPNPAGLGVGNGLEVGGSATFNGKSAKVHWSSAIAVIDPAQFAAFGTPDDYDPPQRTCGVLGTDGPTNQLYGKGVSDRKHDPWLRIKIGGRATIGGAGSVCGKASPYDYNSLPSLGVNCDTPEHNNISVGLNRDLDATNDVSISKISYNDAKAVARKSKFYKGSTAYDSYYYTKSGAAEKDNIYDVAGTQYTFQSRMDGITRGMIFVDTTDRKIPNAAGSNLQELSISGGFSFKGTMILAAKMSVAGLGGATPIPTVQSPPWGDDTTPACDAYPTTSCSANPPTLMYSPMCATAPRITVTNLPVHLRGLIYAFGTIDITGNLQIFGAVITERGFLGTGTPEIWFDYDLKGGNSDGSPIFIRSWREVGPS